MKYNLKRVVVKERILKMKNKLVLFISAFLINGWQFLGAEAVSVVIPKQYLVEKASLVLYMLDGLGNQCVGTCQLNETFEQRNILQEELQIQNLDVLSELSNSIEIVNSSCPCDNDVVLHIEFDKDIRVVRILIVKDSFLADDPFNILSINIGQERDVDDFDALSDMIDGIDSSVMRSAASVEQGSSLGRYILYAKIYCMMQCKHVKHKTRDIMSWFLRKK